MDRRSFFRTCTLGAGALAAGSVLAVPATAAARSYQRVRLLNDRGEVLRAADVTAGSQYVFHYPYAATPCFLLRLDRAVPGRNGLKTGEGAPYDWPGGVGPDKALVAYSAICAHKMAHPTRGISYISFRSSRGGGEPKSGVISCCAENSRYDPSAGGSVLSGPAEQPLATILLEHDAKADELFAVGTLGGEMFHKFFTEFGPRLSLEYPNGNVRTPLSGDVVVKRLEDYSNNVLSC